MNTEATQPRLEPATKCSACPDPSVRMIDTWIIEKRPSTELYRPQTVTATQFAEYVNELRKALACEQQAHKNTQARLTLAYADNETLRGIIASLGRQIEDLK